MISLGTTKKHKKFWKNRKINWIDSYLDGVDPVSSKPMWDHPHRELIVYALKTFGWYSLWEIGCGAGANIKKIVTAIPNKQLGGSDINQDAVDTCNRVFKGGKFHCESSEDILLSDKAVDVILSDAHLLYFSPKDIKKVLKEMKRVGRLRLVLCELHEKSWWKRTIYKFKTGYNVYDYRRLLEDLGCYNIQIIKIPTDFWQGDPWAKFGHIIIAQLP